MFGWDARAALLVVANCSLLFACIVFSAYLRTRQPELPPRRTFLILVVFALWPVGFFFRMPYSESTFLLVSFLFFYGLSRRWSLGWLALVAGMLTAVRPVGVAATAALFWHILFNTKDSRWLRQAAVGFAWIPLALWGVLAYAGYQYFAFGTSLAFVQTQEHWDFGLPASEGLEYKINSLLALEPIWGVYDRDSIRHWVRSDRHGNPLFSLMFWNPILFVTAGILIGWGLVRGWLSGPEIIFGFSLLIIPYLTRAFEMSMASQGRFTAVAFPTYVVLGRMLQQAPEWVTLTVVGLLTVMLMTWTALFAGGYMFF